MALTKERFEQTAYTCSYETYLKFCCEDCKMEDCPHRGAYRRVPIEDGGLGLCPNLQEDSPTE